MRKFLLVLALIAQGSLLDAAKNPHPRLEGFSALPLGAADGSTVGSRRWKAAQNTATWSQMCGAVDSFVAAYNANPATWLAGLTLIGGNWNEVSELSIVANTLNGFTGSQVACHNSAVTYSNLAVAGGDSIATYTDTHRCSGVASLAVANGGTGYTATPTLKFTNTGGSATIIGASWVPNAPPAIGGIATVTVPSFAGIIPTVGWKVTITGVNPAGFNVTSVPITAVTPTSLSFALTANPGPYVIGGALTVTNDNAQLTTYSITMAGASLGSIAVTRAGIFYDNSAPAVTVVRGTGDVTGTGAVVTATVTAPGGGCNNLLDPAMYGNDWRNALIGMATAFDYTYSYLGSGDKAQWVRQLQQSEESASNPSSVLARSLMIEQYSFGPGPGNNVYAGGWSPVVAAAEAISGEGGTIDLTVGCQHGETVCNLGTIAFLKNFANNTVPWFSLQPAQQNAFPNLNSCLPPVAQGTVVAGGSNWVNAGGNGCGNGGMPSDGIEYGPQSQFWMLYGIDLVSGADPATNMWADMPSDYITGNASLLLQDISPTPPAQPGNALFPVWNNYGDQQTPYQFSIETHGSAEILAAKSGNTPTGSYLRYYADNVVPCFSSAPCISHNNWPFYYYDFLYLDESLPTPINFAGNVALDVWFPGSAWMMSKSDSSAAASWFTVNDIEISDNHSQSTTAEITAFTNGAYVLLHSPGYGPPWITANTHNIPTYQGPHEINPGIWKGSLGVTGGDGQGGFKAQFIDTLNNFTYVWHDMTQQYRRTAGVTTGHTTNAVFSGSGLNNLATSVGASPPTVGDSWHFNVQIDGVAVPGCGGHDSFKWARAVNGGALSAYTTGQCITAGGVFITISSPVQIDFKNPSSTVSGAIGHTGSEVWDFYSDNWGDYLNPTLMQRSTALVKNVGVCPGSTCSQYGFVYDRGQFRDSGTNLRDTWNFPYTTPPTLSGGIVTSNYNSSYIYVQPLYASGGFTTNIQDLATIPMTFQLTKALLGPDYQASGAVSYNQLGVKFSQAQVSSVTGATSQTLLHVIQIVNSAVTPTPGVSITATGLNCGQAQDAAQDQVACFSSDAGGVLFTPTSSVTSFTYTRASSSARVFFFELPANIAVKVQVAEAGSNSTIGIASTACTCAGYTTLNTSTQGTLVVNDPLTGGALSIIPPSLANGVIGYAYSQQFVATGGTGPYTWTTAAPDNMLQAGLGFSSSGAVTGTPSAAGTNLVTFRATDSLGAKVSITMPLTIAPAISISTASPLPTGTQAVPYSQPIAVSGGNPPYACSTTPALSTIAAFAGLSISVAPNNAGCLIGGTPTSGGTATFTVNGSDSTIAANSGPATASQSYSLTITTPAPGITITNTPPLAPGVAGSNYSVQMLASGGTGMGQVWSLIGGALPTGSITLSSGGLINGIPTTPGTYNPQVQVTDSGSNTTSGTFPITITAGLVISPAGPALPGGQLNIAYPGVTFTASGGTAPYTWSVPVGVLPAGLTLDPTTGILSGTPGAPGADLFSVMVADTNGINQTVNYSLTVTAGSVVQSVVLGNAVVN